MIRDVPLHSQSGADKVRRDGAPRGTQISSTGAYGGRRFRRRPGIYAPRVRSKPFGHAVIRWVFGAGLEDRTLGAAGSPTQYVRPVFRGRLLPGALHLPQIQQTPVHPLHVAGKGFREPDLRSSWFRSGFRGNERNV